MDSIGDAIARNRSTGGFMDRGGAAQPIAEVAGSLFFAAAAQCTFPDYGHPPAEREKMFPDLTIAGSIALELRKPIVAVGRRSRRVPASGMPVPEASVHKAHCPVPPEDQVRFPWKRAAVEPEPESSCVDGSPQETFGPSVLAADPRHDPRARRPVHGIGHRVRLSTRRCRLGRP